MDSKVSLQSVFVLHHFPYGDSSVIFDVLTKDFGRISLLAKGYRRQKKRIQTIQAFSELLVSWSGKSDLKTITSVESLKNYSTLMGNYMYAGLYVNELLIRLLQRFDPHPNIFSDYQNLLSNFQNQSDVECTLRVFEFNLLSELGYGVDCRIEASNGAEIRSELYYQFVSEQGFFPIANNSEQKTDVFLGKDLLGISQSEFEKLEVKRAAKRLVRIALAPLLGSKPLKSRELFLHSK